MSNHLEKKTILYLRGFEKAGFITDTKKCFEKSKLFYGYIGVWMHPLLKRTFSERNLSSRVCVKGTTLAKAPLLHFRGLLEICVSSQCSGSVWYRRNVSVFGFMPAGLVIENCERSCDGSWRKRPGKSTSRREASWLSVITRKIWPSVFVYFFQITNPGIWMYKCLRLIFQLTTGLEPLGFRLRLEDLGERHQQSLVQSAPGLRLYNHCTFCNAAPPKGPLHRRRRPRPAAQAAMDRRARRYPNTSIIIITIICIILTYII